MRPPPRPSLGPELPEQVRQGPLPHGRQDRPVAGEVEYHEVVVGVPPRLPAGGGRRVSHRSARSPRPKSGGGRVRRTLRHGWPTRADRVAHGAEPLRQTGLLESPFVPLAGTSQFSRGGLDAHPVGFDDPRSPPCTRDFLRTLWCPFLANQMTVNGQISCARRLTDWRNRPTDRSGKDIMICDKTAAERRWAS